MQRGQWSLARCQAGFQHQRKLFLLVFLWTCLCLLLFRSSLFGAQPQQQQQLGDERQQQAPDGRSARSPVTSAHWAAPQPVAAALGPSSSAPPPPAHQHEQHKQQQQQQQQQQQEQPQVEDVGEMLRWIEGANECRYDYPNLLDLQFNNVHWQRMTSSLAANGSPAAAAANSSHQDTATKANYYLYNAYYDDRWRGGLPSVRILAMIDRIAPPPTSCLLWQDRLREPTEGAANGRLVPMVVEAHFVYAWYPKWGNYRDGLLQPWIITCYLPKAHSKLVPDSVSLVESPRAAQAEARRRRQAQEAGASSPANSIAMPAAYSSSSSPVSSQQQQQLPQQAADSQRPATGAKHLQDRRDCSHTAPITNNLPVFNRRPKVKGKFAVCVKGLDFPHEDVSVRLVEWLELLNLLGAGKIFLYSLNVHENISRVLHHYQQRGLVELSPLTLPGDQPNLPEYQHLFLKSKLTAKRQNELIPYNDCLYRNLHSYQYLALLDIDEIIMPLKQRTWHELMEQVESMSLQEQNYSRASYNVRNVYFFDDLSGPLGTTSSSSSSSSSSSPSPDGDDDQDDAAAAAGDGASVLANLDGGEEEPEAPEELERGIPHYLHMMQHVYRSKNYTKPGQYVKCFHNTERVVSLHNHFPMNCFGQCTTYSVPIELAHLQHYRKDCVGPLKQSCKSDFRVFTTRDTTIWKYRQQMIRRTTRVLNQLGLLGPKARNRQHSAASNSIT